MHVLNPDSVVVAPELMQVYAPTLAEMKCNGETLVRQALAMLPPTVAVEPFILEGNPAHTIVEAAAVHRDGPVFEDVVQRYERERGTDRARISSVVLVRVERAAPLVSPAYADGSSEATIEQRSLDMYGLMRK